MDPVAERNHASAALPAWQRMFKAAWRAWCARLAISWRRLDWWPRSLRVRLALWYGTLLAAVLCLFGVAVLLLTTNVMMDGIDAAVRAEGRVATTDLQHALLPTAPYWPQRLGMPAVDADRDPGITVVALDAKGNVRYVSSGGQISQNPLVTSAPVALPLDSPHFYTTRVGDVRIRVMALPIYAPGTGEHQSAPIGMLLVGKSLSDTDATLATLRTLLLAVGALAICAALIGGWAIAGRVLQPLAAVAETAGAIATATRRGKRLGGLSRRVRRPGGEDELAHLVDTFNAMLAELEAATVTQRRFVADASHELRAPLTTIQGNVALLLSHKDTIPALERQAMLTDAHAEAVRLTGLVNALLLLARADSIDEQQAAGAQGTVQNRLVDLDRIVLDVVRQMRMRLAAESSDLEIQLDRFEPARVRGDKTALRQVLVILLDNAAKYTPVTGREASVTVTLSRQDDQALLSVRDNGIGIDPADAPHIFERFYRADRVRDRQGAGLGLPIAQSLIEQHGGAITVESEPGHGTAFTVRLPLAVGA
jgi:signal transduction histidine kinase